MRGRKRNEHPDRSYHHIEMDGHRAILQTSGLATSAADPDNCLLLTTMYDEIYALLVKHDQLGEIAWDHVPFETTTVRRGHWNGYTILKHNDNRYDISVPATDPFCKIVYHAITDSFQGCFAAYLQTHDLRYAVGLLPASGLATDGPWHRDTTSHEQSYLTAFLYVNEDSDAYTEILLNSHLDTRSIQDVVQDTSYTATRVYPQRRKTLVFDGRLVHRGCGATTHAMNRKLVYMTIHSSCYVDPLYHRSAYFSADSV